MSKRVEVNLPDQASDQAQAVIPADAVPRAAAAIRAAGMAVSDGEDDVVVRDFMLDQVRDAIYRQDYEEARRRLREEIVVEPVEW